MLDWVGTALAGLAVLTCTIPRRVNLGGGVSMMITGIRSAGSAGGRAQTMTGNLAIRDAILEVQSALDRALVAAEGLMPIGLPSHDDLARVAAARHNLPPELVLAIVKVESAGNPWATRFEPAFYRNYVLATPERYGSISIETERRDRSTSWGLCQVMGQTARELGFRGAYLSELCDPAVGLEYGCLYLARQVQRYDGHLDAAVAAYNAGSARRGTDGRWRNQAYVEKVRKAGGL